MRDERSGALRPSTAKSAAEGPPAAASRRAVRAGANGDMHRPTGVVATANYDALTDLLGFWIRRAEVKVMRSFAHHLEPYGVTPTEVAALILIGANRGLSQTALASALATDQSTVVNLLTGLERRSLVLRMRDAQDRRYYVLSLTAEGRTLVRGIKAALARHNRALQAGLSQRDTAVLMAALRRFVEA